MKKDPAHNAHNADKDVSISLITGKNNKMILPRMLRISSRGVGGDRFSILATRFKRFSHEMMMLKGLKEQNHLTKEG